MFKRVLVGTVALAFILVGATHAQDSSSGSGVGILDASKEAGLSVSCPEGVPNCMDGTDYSTTGAQNFTLKILGGLLNFVALIAVVMLVVVGLKLVIAMGNQEALQGAKKQALWIFGGLAITILSLLIVKNVVEKVFSVASESVSSATSSSAVAPRMASPEGENQEAGSQNVEPDSGKANSDESSSSEFIEWDGKKLRLQPDGTYKSSDGTSAIIAP